MKGEVGMTPSPTGRMPWAIPPGGGWSWYLFAAVAAAALAALQVHLASREGGMAHWLQLAAFVIAVGVVARAVLSHHARLRAMAWQNTLLSRAVAQSSALVVITDADARIEYVNPHFSEFTGYALDEVVGRNPRFLASGRTPGERYVELWRALRTAGRWRGEFCNRKRNGEVYWATASISAVRDEHGRTTHYLAVEEDITARKEAEGALVELTQSLEQRVEERTEALARANRELEAFNSTLSHDLRRPLRAIRGFAELLNDDHADRLDGEARDYLGRIRDAADRMDLLIDDLLKLARVQQSPIERRPCDLTALARGIVDELRRAEPERRVRVRVAEALRAAGDPDLCRVALENLLHNAWKYTRRKPEAEIEVGAAGAAYYVRDDGAGFDAAANGGRLFRAFERFHGREFEGTGVGLATVRRIVERHGGRVWVESSPGAGATFWFTLGPDAEAPPAA
jgi:PAS domain S-box-containing protein